VPLGQEDSDSIYENEEQKEEKDIFDPDWGKKKQLYYNTDYVDDEESSDQQALDEEEAAKSIQKRNWKILMKVILIHFLL